MRLLRKGWMRWEGQTRRVVVDNYGKVFWQGRGIGAHLHGRGFTVHHDGAPRDSRLYRRGERRNALRHRSVAEGSAKEMGGYATSIPPRG
jgi:hypothetical protein